MAMLCSRRGLSWAYHSGLGINARGQRVGTHTDAFIVLSLLLSIPLRGEAAEGHFVLPPKSPASAAWVLNNIIILA